MEPQEIELLFRKIVCDSITLFAEGENRYRVFTPFSFDDGDHLVIVLRRDGDRWVLSDEGHTFMHLSYSLEERSYQTGTRQKIIENALSVYGIEDRGGELVIQLNGNPANALYDFIQAVLRISDVTLLSRERVQSTFMEDFHALMSDIVPSERRKFKWFYEMRDPQGHYQADVYVNGSASPLAIYGLSSDNQVRDATIALLKFEQWDLPIRGVGIFEDQETVQRDVLARFSDVCEKQFSNLVGENRDRIARYIAAQLGGGRGAQTPPSTTRPPA